MNANIEKRLAKLENRIQSTHEDVTIIIRALVAADEGKPREPQPEVIGVGTMGSNWHLSRNPGESVEDFTERAKASVPRSEHGFASILFKYAD